MTKGVNASTKGDRAPREGDSVVGGGLKGKAERGIEVSSQAYMRDAHGFFLGFSSSVGGIVLLLLLFKMAPWGGVFRPILSACLVFVGTGREDLGSESNCTIAACPWDVAN